MTTKPMQTSRGKKSNKEDKMKKILHSPTITPHRWNNLQLSPFSGTACGQQGMNVWVSAKRRDVTCKRCLKILAPPKQEVDKGVI